MSKKSYFIILMIVGFIIPNGVKADPSADVLVNKTQKNYKHVLSMSGTYQLISRAEGRLTMSSRNYTYEIGRKMNLTFGVNRSDKADGEYEYHAKGESTTKNRVKKDDLFYLPFGSFVTLAPTLIDGMNLNVKGEEVLDGKRLIILEGRLKGVSNPDNRIVWKVDQNTAAVLEVDFYDSHGKLAEDMKVTYYKLKGIRVPARIEATYYGKIIKSQLESEFDIPNIDVSPLTQTEIAENAANESSDSTPTPNAASMLQDIPTPTPMNNFPAWNQPHDHSNDNSPSPRSRAIDSDSNIVPTPTSVTSSPVGPRGNGRNKK